MAQTLKHFKTAVVHDETGRHETTLKKTLDGQGVQVSLSSHHKIDVDTDLYIYVADKGNSQDASRWEHALGTSSVVIATSKDPDEDDGSQFLGILSRINQGKDVMHLLNRQGDSAYKNISEEDLLKALHNNEFQLWYQPVMTAADQTIAGFEALIRWKDPVTGEIIFPDRFMPELETKDFIVPFGFWIIEEACRQLSEWNNNMSIKKPLRIGVNLSARQFTCTELVEKTIQIIEKYGVDPNHIALEITESAFMDDMDTANMMLLTLRSKDVKIYLDDFGTGFSSLSYLLHFPVNTIKIDKSFVQWMHVDEQSEEIVRSIISLAHNLKMTVVAEGVEIKEHVDMLRDMGCDLLQGYYFAKPLCVADAVEFLKKFSGTG